MGTPGRGRLVECEIVDNVADGDGTLVLSFPWGAFPSGTTPIFPYWIADAGGPVGFAAGNGVSGTSP